MSGYGWRPHLESALSLNLREMFARGWLLPGRASSGSLSWSRHGEPIGNIGYSASVRDDDGDLTLNYTLPDRDGGERKDVTCRIRLSSIPLHYGGRRWYAHCPYTNRRVLKLYKFSSIEQFCCREAVKPLPTYASQRESGSNRCIAQRWAIRRKLGDDFTDLFGEPLKPKWMRWHTFNRYAARDAELAGRENRYLLRFIGRRMF